MIKWESYDDAKQRIEKKVSKHADKPLTRKEVMRHIISGELTTEQANELRQKYMDSLEYTDASQPLPDCGGIQPLPILIWPTEEE